MHPQTSDQHNIPGCTCVDTAHSSLMHIVVHNNAASTENDGYIHVVDVPMGLNMEMSDCTEPHHIVDGVDSLIYVCSEPDF